MQDPPVQNTARAVKREKSVHDPLETLVSAIRACRLCVSPPCGVPLPHVPRPVLQVSGTARLLICGQAPGMRVHQSGIPFDDASGQRLRLWLGMDKATFYDRSCVNIVPMGFCFPGTAPDGSDYPPRPECRATWHDGLFALMPQIDTILMVGGYAQQYHLARAGIGRRDFTGVTKTVAQWRAFTQMRPRLFPLPHPSWRNTGWLKRNPWFETEVLPDLRATVAQTIGTPAT